MSSGELISIREFSRRIGVSDTAVHKGLRSGRVVLSEDKRTGRKGLMWPQSQQDWLANTDGMKRSHVGSQGSPRRAGDDPVVRLVTSGNGGGSRPLAGPVDDVEPQGTGARLKAPDYAQSRAIREAYQARLAKLEYEQRAGKLVDAEQVASAWVQIATTTKTKVMGLPSKAKQAIPSLTLEQVAALERLCRDALEELADRR